MRRADRLFQIVQLIRGRRLTAAAHLAQCLEWRCTPLPAVQITLQALREAVQARRKLLVDYRDASDQLSQRTLRPLGCFYWGKVWTLAAWCEIRHDFRSFRLDRIDRAQEVEDAAGQFRDEAGKLADYLRAVAPPSVQAKWSNEA